MTAFLLSNSHWLPSQKSATPSTIGKRSRRRSHEMVDEFNQLRNAQRFEEMEPVARRLIELAPKRSGRTTSLAERKVYSSRNDE